MKARLAALVILCSAPGAGAQDPAAVLTGSERTKHFEIRYRPGSRSEASVDRVAKGSMTTEDVLQATLEKLVVGAPPAPPKLAQYLGRGPLVGWVGVVAVREALGSRRRDRPNA